MSDAGQGPHDGMRARRLPRGTDTSPSAEAEQRSSNLMEGRCRRGSRSRRRPEGDENGNKKFEPDPTDRWLRGRGCTAKAWYPRMMRNRGSVVRQTSLALSQRKLLI